MRIFWSTSCQQSLKQQYISADSLGCLSLEFVKVNLGLINSFNKIKHLLSGVVYSSQGTGFYVFSILYFPRTLCRILLAVINSAEQ